MPRHTQLLPGRSARRSAILPILILLAACGSSPKSAGEPADAPSGQRVENESSGLAIASVPVGFALDINEGDTLRFVRTDGTPGTLTVVASASQFAGINLVQATRGHKEEILARSEGRYNGSLELLGPLGTAFQSRGRYQAEDGNGMIEDFRIFSLHPAGDRLLTLQYVYPGSDDMAQRQEHLFAMLGEIEAISPVTG